MDCPYHGSLTTLDYLRLVAQREQFLLVALDELLVAQRGLVVLLRVVLPLHVDVILVLGSKAV